MNLLAGVPLEVSGQSEAHISSDVLRHVVSLLLLLFFLPLRTPPLSPSSPGGALCSPRSRSWQGLPLALAPCLAFSSVSYFCLTLHRRLSLTSGFEAGGGKGRRGGSAAETIQIDHLGGRRGEGERGGGLRGKERHKEARNSRPHGANSKRNQSGS